MLDAQILKVNWKNENQRTLSHETCWQDINTLTKFEAIDKIPFASYIRSSSRSAAEFWRGSTSAHFYQTQQQVTTSSETTDGTGMFRSLISCNMKHSGSLQWKLIEGKKVIYEDVAHWNAHIWERTLWWKQSNQFSSYHPLGLSKRLSFAATRFIEFLLETRRMKRLLEN